MNIGETLVNDVVNKKLCTGCGTCLGVCPADALTFENEKIKVCDDKCISCGTCLKVCPGSGYDFSENEQTLLGHYESIYNGYAIDDDVRRKGASGGVVSALLIYLLANGLVDGVVVGTETGNNERRFESKIVTKVDEVISAAQSKYYLYPANYILKDIRAFGGKVAIVGLPCEIQGIKKALLEDSVLSEKVELLISLFCGFNMVREATDYLIKKSKINRDKIQRIEYRAKKDNETGFCITSVDGEKFFVSKHGYTFLNILFSPERCWLCYDYSGEFADISVGDAWDAGNGFSRIIARTNKGVNYLSKAVADGAVSVTVATENDIYESQKMVLNYKKSQIAYRLNKSKDVPDYGINISRIKGVMKLKATILYFMLRFFKTNFGRFTIKLLPFKLMTGISGWVKGNEIIS